mgnify:FL=1
MIKITEKYNGNLILMFHGIYFRCETKKGTKYEFFISLSDLATKPTIYTFLNFLERYGALEKVGNNKYKINKKKFQEAFYLHPDGQKARELVKEFSAIIID